MKKVIQSVSPDVKDFVNLIRKQSVRNTSRLLDHETFLRTFKSKETPDAELIKDYNLNHNERAFDELYRRHKSKMLEYLYGILGNWEDAKDVLHDSWEVVLKSINNHRYNEQDDFAGWFKSICYRQASEWKRDKRRFFYGSNNIPDHADTTFNADQLLLNHQNEMLLHKAINRLPESEKQMILLRHFQNMSFDEIAIVRHVTTAAARSRYCKALKKLNGFLS